MSIQSLALDFQSIKTENCLQKTGFCVDFRGQRPNSNKSVSIAPFFRQNSPLFSRSQLTFRLLHNPIAN
jgi:hypothetical protein